MYVLPLLVRHIKAGDLTAGKELGEPLLEPFRFTVEDTIPDGRIICLRS